MPHSVLDEINLDHSSNSAPVDTSNTSHRSDDTEANQWYRDLPRNGYSTDDSNNPYWHKRWENYRHSSGSTPHLEQDSFLADEDHTPSPNNADNMTRWNIPASIIVTQPQPSRLGQLTAEYIHTSWILTLACTYRTVLERRIQNLNTLALRPQSRRTRAWRSIKAQELLNKVKIWRRLRLVQGSYDNTIPLIPQIGGLLRLKLRVNPDTPSEFISTGESRTDESPTNQLPYHVTNFTLHRLHLRWAIWCCERDIIGTTADSLHDYNPGYTFLRGEIAQVLQAHITYIHSTELHTSESLDELLFNNIRSSAHWHQLLGLLFDPYPGALDIT
jgi:hypothetical protein